MRSYATEAVCPGLGSKWCFVFCLFLSLVFTLATASVASSDDPNDDDEVERSLRFKGKATLGSRLYLVTSPFDTSNVSDFFSQWGYIRNQGGRPPYFVDLFHAELGIQRSDETWMARVERWSLNSLNERGLFEFDWKGLGVEGDWRRYRGDFLRLFPEGTTEGDAFASDYQPDSGLGNYEALFDADRRFWIRRQSIGGEVSLRPEESGFELPGVSELDLFGRYETRDGYRQDSFCLPICIPGLPASLLGPGFQGKRREVDETISTVGGGLVFDLFPLFTGALRVRFQSFRENAPIQTAAYGGSVTAVNFVPDTERLSGRFEFSRRFGSARLQGGAALNHLEQVGRKAPTQQALGFGDNERTSYSLWTSFDWPLAREWNLSGFAKWYQLHNEMNSAQLSPGATVQDSPYIESLGKLGAEVELSFRPAAGLRAAFGYRADYSHRSLRYGSPGVNSSLSVIRPDSLHHIFYLSGRMRWRALRLDGELGFDWGPETAYPNEFSRAVFFEGRGSYTFPLTLPVTISVTASVTDGKAPGFDLVASNRSSKQYERLAWRYDVTVAATPVGDLSLFASYAQQQDDQQFNHIRIQDPRSWPLPNDLFIDSNQRYRSDLYSLTVGGSHPVGKRVDVSSAVGLTFTRGRFKNDSTTAASLNTWDRLRNRIIRFETDIDYAVSEVVTLGAGYRLQNYDDSLESRFLDYSETVHTFTLRVSVDFSALVRQ